MRLHHASTATSSPARTPRVRTVFQALAACALALVVAVPSAVATPLAEKQARAAELDRQVSGLEDRYAGLQERYRGSLVELRQIRKDVTKVQARLERSRADLADAKVRLEDRALAIYRDGAGSTQLLEIARAGSFSEFFERVDAIERVGDQDTDIVERVADLTAKVETQERKLRTSRDRKAAVVRRAAVAKKRMARTLATKQQALGSVTAEIRGIMAQQRAAEAARLATLSADRVAAIRSGGTAADVDDAGATPAATGGTGATGATGGASSGSSGGGSSTGTEGGGSSFVALPPPSGSASSAAGIAMGKVGAPYSYGASGPSSFDCSGLVVWAFAQAGRGGLPHSTYSLIGMGVEVPLSQAQVGDLVFTNNSGHMGIYVGGGSFVHAPREGRTVAVEPLTYYTVVSVRRI